MKRFLMVGASLFFGSILFLRAEHQTFESSFLLAVGDEPCELTLRADDNLFTFKLRKTEGDLVLLDVKFDIASDVEAGTNEENSEDEIITRKRKHFKADKLFKFLAVTCASATRFTQGTGADLVLGFFGSAFTLFGQLVEKDQAKHRALSLCDFHESLRSFCIGAAGVVGGQGLTRMKDDSLGVLRTISLFEGEEQQALVDKILSSPKEVAGLMKESFFVFQNYCTSAIAFAFEKVYEKTSLMLETGGYRGQCAHFATEDVEAAVWIAMQALKEEWGKEELLFETDTRGNGLAFLALLSSLFVAVSELETITDPEERVQKLKKILLGLVGDMLTLGLTSGSELFVIFENVLSYLLPAHEKEEVLSEVEKDEWVLSAKSMAKTSLDSEEDSGELVAGLFACLNAYSQHLSQKMFIRVVDGMREILPRVE
jgi:hypothetical protein